MTLYSIIKENYEAFKIFQRSGIIPASQIAYIESYEYYLQLKEEDPKISMRQAAEEISERNYRNKVSVDTVLNRIKKVKYYKIG